MNTTASIKTFKGIPISVPNKISKNKKDFHISYNNRDISHYGAATTAIYINSTSQFLILNGDHTKAYKNLDTLQDHLDYFYANINKANPKSEHGKLFKILDNGKGAYINGGF